MNILAFDTCLDKMYVALGTEKNILSSKVIETTKEHYHSAFLISTIKEILKENSITPDNVDVLVTNVGPGSFTGIRACTTVARVFAQGKNKKVLGISSLELLSKINKTDKKTLVALDARKDMAYSAIFNKGQQISEPKAIQLDDLIEIISKEDYSIITDNALEEKLNGISYQTQKDDLGIYLIEIARQKLKSGSETNWQKLLPLYIQPPTVTVKKS